MSFKTILVHVNDERRVGSLVDAAISIGSRFDAHIIALYVLPPIPTYGPTSFGASYVQSALATFREEADRVHKAFEDAARGRSIAPEWRLVEPGEATVADCVVEQARSCDLAIVGQRDRSFDFSSVLDVPERVIFESGRPTLVIPYAGRFPSIGKRITVSWNSRREAARAVFDALPLLQKAEQVKIVWFNPEDDRTVARDVPGAEIASNLARHGVRCEAATATASDMKLGDVMLSGLSDDGADLLVMGAWGHSRMRELIFGGATQHILEHMTVPVLMSH